LQAVNLRLILKEIRTAKGWSLRRMAKEIGIDFTVLCRCEAGQSLDHANLCKLVKWLFS